MIGVDVSHWNTSAQLARAIADGAEFVIAKANTGSSTTPDPKLAAHVAVARHAGLHVGMYHFAIDVTEAEAEADAFLVTANPQPGDILVLDLEATNGDWAQRAAYAYAWLQRVQMLTGARPILYVNGSWDSNVLSEVPALGNFPLWIATAGQVAGQPKIAGKPVAHWVLHQYSTAGGIDHDLLAPGAKWSDFAIPLEHTDAPEPVDVGEDMAAGRLFQDPPKSGSYFLAWFDPAMGVVKVRHVDTTADLNAIRLVQGDAAGVDGDVPFVEAQLVPLRQKLVHA